MLRADFQRALAESWNLSLPWDLRFGVWNFRARAAFTLIELLITITIISVLVAIGIPATERIVHKGRATHCLGNLRNLGAAMQLYLNDHNNVMPTLLTARESKDDEEPAIDNTLDEYTSDEKTFCCKADSKRLWETTGTSYLWNNLLNGQDASSLNVFGFIKDGTRIPVIFDKEGWHKYRDVQVNILYADGHADKDIKFVTGDGGGK
jgi:prepilin-type N-terminal cleavage/methylation domain-containing protein/prepilin-type processing-associated H-X9-DG protein